MGERIVAAVIVFLMGHFAAYAQSTTRVSVSSDGAQGNGGSLTPMIAAEGRFVAFSSSASNLVPGDTNGTQDIFLHDRQSGQTTRVSVSSEGIQGNDNFPGSTNPTVSADGRFVAFESYASNLVPNDTNGTKDIFVHDRLNGQTTRVSVRNGGWEVAYGSSGPAISADGRFVAFHSDAINLVPGDTNGLYDVFLHDRESGQTTRVSIGSGGVQANGGSASPAISANGQLVAFSSSANNLVPDDTNNVADIFVHDRQSGQTTRVSVNSKGEQANNFPGSSYPVISADGRLVAFSSSASNLVPNDTNGTTDVFVHDRQSGQTTRVSVSSDGEQGSAYSYQPAISADGRFVAFISGAANLVPGDTNNVEDVFIHDRQSSQTTRVSVSSEGGQGASPSQAPSVSADGRFVAFESLASNLVPGDTNSRRDVFVHDRGESVVDCAADANGDNQVNGADLSVLLSLFGQSVTPGAGADFNGDGMVDGADLSVLLFRFGTICV